MMLLPGPYSIDAGTIDSWPAHVRQDAKLYDTWVRLPKTTIEAAPMSQQLVKDVRTWTGWSQRQLARVLGTTHPTIRTLESGKPVTRVEDLVTRLQETHGVIARIFLLADRQQRELQRLLSTRPVEHRLAALALLEERRPADAYRAVLEVLRPQHQGGMIQSVFPAKGSGRTVSLLDESSHESETRA